MTPLLNSCDARVPCKRMSTDPIRASIENQKIITLWHRVESPNRSAWHRNKSPNRSAWHRNKSPNRSAWHRSNRQIAVPGTDTNRQIAGHLNSHVAAVVLCEVSAKLAVELAYEYAAYDTRLGDCCSERNAKIIRVLPGACGYIGNAGLRRRQRALARSI